MKKLLNSEGRSGHHISQYFESLLLFLVMMMIIIIIMIGSKGNLPLMWTPDHVGGMVLPTITDGEWKHMQ